MKQGSVSVLEVHKREEIKRAEDLSRDWWSKKLNFISVIRIISYQNIVSVDTTFYLQMYKVQACQSSPLPLPSEFSNDL
jgi:hypothetical protein